MSTRTTVCDTYLYSDTATIFKAVGGLVPAMATAQSDDPDGRDEDDVTDPNDRDGAADGDGLSDLAYVGPRTAERLSAAGVTVGDVREKRVSYRDLVSAGVNSGVAAKLRREHSLHWTLDEQCTDLGRRSEQVRGLRDGEREWVAAARSGDEADAASRRDADSDEREGADDLPSWPGA